MVILFYFKCNTENVKSKSYLNLIQVDINIVNENIILKP